ncbi:MAG: hypothetical protein LIP03_01330, partial [Bacteroidales bacterium]|nr:hypothetical protein [Bacteroidales bacterium]
WSLGGWGLLLLTLASCSGSDAPVAESNAAHLTIAISCADGATGRAASYTEMADASEGIFDWFVVLCQGDKTTYVIDGHSDLGGVKEDGLTTDDEYPTGTYTAYSFANISVADLGITSSTTASQIEAMTIATNGNLIDTSAAHIPMTNVETVTFASDGVADHDLHVVRLYAKMQLSITNSTGEDITVKSLSITDITTDGAEIPMLPNPGATSEASPCLPNFNAKDVTTATLAWQQSIAIADGATKTCDFYLNESATPTNRYGLFMLTLSLETADGAVKEMRYALITDNASGEWSYIARNDYRKIPISLIEYKMDIIPIDFPPIGVYPASVKEEDGLFTVTFHAGGHFHLVPRVTRMGTELPWADGTNWDILCDTNGDVTGWQYVSGDAETDLFDYSTDLTDGSDNGGAPIWDSVNGFIFGRFADGATGSARYTLTLKVGNRTLTYPIIIILSP